MILGIIQLFKNMISAAGSGGRETVDLNSQKLLEWLGIDKEDVKAINECTYYTCLKILSETMGKLPLKYYQRDESGGLIRAPSTKMSRLLSERPNPCMSASTFWTVLEANCHHFGNAYAWIQTQYERAGKYGGEIKPISIWPMPSDCVEVYMDDVGAFGNAGKLYYRYSDPKTGKTYTFGQENVLHFKTWLSWDGIMGKSVQDILKDSITGAGQSQKYLNTLYKSGLTAAAVLQYVGDLDKAKRTRLQKEYNDLLSGAKNAGKVVALPVGMTLQPLSYKLTDAQYLELKQYTALQIAAAFGVKPTQINDYTKSSYASSEAQQLSFLIDTMLYRLNQYEQEINFKCLSAGDREDGYLFKFNEKAILRPDAKTQMSTITSAIQNGVYTPNEGRHLLDLPSMKGGDVLIVNGNYVPLMAVGAAYGLSAMYSQSRKPEKKEEVKKNDH